MYNILEQIRQPNDIKNINPAQYKELAKEIRACLIRNVSKTGGHLASNLGVVELTMAIHLCLTFPEDKVIWDVGHQSYVHKILTGRKDMLRSLRQYDGISGFPKMCESSSDAFNTGHASTSVSAALGYAFSRQMQGRNNKVFAVIGDGSMTGGMFYEALNNAVTLKSNMVIVLNDNNMSISRNVGGMSSYLTRIRTADRYRQLNDNVKGAIKSIPGIGDSVVEKVSRSKSSLKRLMIPGMMFEDMGLTYIGPVDGHNINELVRTFKDAMRVNEPVIVHVKTKKGKGYRLAEENPSYFHGIEPFIVKSGELKNKPSDDRPAYTKVFGRKICELAEKDESIAAICAAMPQGTGLSDFAEKFKDRFFDVGIAEEHAVTFAAALSADNMKPVVAIYSTFLQRSFDQILHDVCICGHHVVFAIDRSGIVGNDGETHQGIYDISYLTSIPGLTVMAPKNDIELENMLEYAIYNTDGPVAIRYPRGKVCDRLHEYNAAIEYGKAELMKKGEKVMLLAFGSMVNAAAQVCDRLDKECGINATLVNLRFASPVDYDLIDELCRTHDIVVTLEENILSGSLSEHIASHLMWKGYNNIKCIPVTLPDSYIEHGAQDALRAKYGLGADDIFDKVRRCLIEGKT